MAWILGSGFLVSRMGMMTMSSPAKKWVEPAKKALFLSLRFGRGQRRHSWRVQYRAKQRHVDRRRQIHRIRCRQNRRSSKIGYRSRIGRVDHGYIHLHMHAVRFGW